MSDNLENVSDSIALDPTITTDLHAETATPATSSISIRVAEALEEDIDQGVVRLNLTDLDYLGVIPGAPLGVHPPGQWQYTDTEQDVVLLPQHVHSHNATF
jgi:hypothetical protein